MQDIGFYIEGHLENDKRVKVFIVFSDDLSTVRINCMSIDSSRYASDGYFYNSDFVAEFCIHDAFELLLQYFDSRYLKVATWLSRFDRRQKVYLTEYAIAAIEKRKLNSCFHSDPVEDNLFFSLL